MHKKYLSILQKNDNESDARMWAIEKLTEQGILVDIVKNCSDGHIRQLAINKLVNQDFLYEVANDDTEKYIYTWEESSFAYTHRGITNELITKTLDLRDTARKRLEELKNK